MSVGLMGLLKGIFMQLPPWLFPLRPPKPAARYQPQKPRFATRTTAMFFFRGFGLTYAKAATLDLTLHLLACALFQLLLGNPASGLRHTTDLQRQTRAGRAWI